MLSLLLWYHSQFAYRNNLRTVHLWPFYIFLLLVFSFALSHSFSSFRSLPLSHSLPLPFPRHSLSLYFSFRLTNSQLRHARPYRVKRNFWSLHARRVCDSREGLYPMCADPSQNVRTVRTSTPKPFLASPVRGKTTETKTERDTVYESTERGRGKTWLLESIRTNRKKSEKSSHCNV